LTEEELIETNLEKKGDVLQPEEIGWMVTKRRVRQEDTATTFDFLRKYAEKKRDIGGLTLLVFVEKGKVQAGRGERTFLQGKKLSKTGTPTKRQRFRQKL